MDRKDTSILLYQQLDEDLKLEHDKLEEKYSKLKNKYIDYYYSLEFRTIKEAQCGYCGLHNYHEHKQEIGGSTAA